MTEHEKKSPEHTAGLEQQQSRLLCRAVDSAGITASDLWLRYFSIGGNAGEYEVDAYVQSVLSLPPHERDLLAHAANELIDELPPRPRAPYVEELDRPARAVSPEAAPRQMPNP
jgi:hypothetical protein